MTAFSSGALEDVGFGEAPAMQAVFGEEIFQLTTCLL